MLLILNFNKIVPYKVGYDFLIFIILAALTCSFITNLIITNYIVYSPLY
jgi:hypothetical protein